MKQVQDIKGHPCCVKHDFTLYASITFLSFSFLFIFYVWVGGGGGGRVMFATNTVDNAEKDMHPIFLNCICSWCVCLS